uniref:Homeobox protein ATH1 n=1 Tax=Anthurium amnicola TaxID=1678845 RepID=A0A1D1ZF00_9ARAE
MENDIYSLALPITSPNPMALEEASSHVLSDPILHQGALENNGQRHIMAGYPFFSSLQEEDISNLHITNHDNVVNSEMAASRYTSLACDTYGSSDLREHLIENSLSAASIASLLSGSASAIPSASTLPSSEIRTFISNNSCNTLNSSLSASENCAFGADDAELLAPKRDLNMTGPNFRWSCDEIMGHQVLPGRTMTTVRPSYHVVSSSDPAWLPNKSTLNSDDQYDYCTPSNELSLTLGSSRLSIMNIPSIPDQCSEISCSAITQVTSKDNRHGDATELPVCSHFLRHSANDVGLGMGLESRHMLPHNEDLSLDCGSSKHIRFSHMLLASRYLHVVQQVLSEVTSHALENQNELDYSSARIGNESMVPFPAMSSDEFHHPSGEIRSHDRMDFLLQREEPKTKKTELISMLNMIDHGYDKCMDQIQNVVTAFREATNSSNAQLPARFALRSISILYKNLRERITSQLLLVSQCLSGEFMLEKEKSFEPSFIQRQWALQQLRRNEQQSWRPQRGLPEKSVAVLRAWMFQNFLHPYPKDSEKQLLAMKSGLTRSQVSNWFINARVRLWKPMIEEMYSEISRKSRTEEGTVDHRSDANSGSRRIRLN